MTWHETHQRTRIIREVEAFAAADFSGRLPWRDAWAPYVGDRDGLLRLLRARWDRACEAQLDATDGEDAFHDTHRRLRRTYAGVLRILEAHPVTPPAPVAPEPVAAAPA
jgi:hypothetical protein